MKRLLLSHHLGLPIGAAILFVLGLVLGCLAISPAVSYAQANEDAPTDRPLIPARRVATSAPMVLVLTATPTLVPTALPTATTTMTPTATAVPPSPTAMPSPTETLAVATLGTRTAWSLGGITGQVQASPEPSATLTAGTRTPTREFPPPPPIRYAGVPTVSVEAKWLDASTLWLGVPHRTQMDNTLYAQSNCGPASLGMILEAYGLKGYPTDALRGEVNRFQGNFDPNEGTSLPALAAVAQRAGLLPIGLYGSGLSYKRWSLDDLRESLKAGRPIITLVRYADLPGNGYFAGDTNHYIVLSGLAGDNFIYNDSAYTQGMGRGLMIPPEVLLRAWGNSVIPSHAMSLGLDRDGTGLIGRRIPDPDSDDDAWMDEPEDEIVDAVVEAVLAIAPRGGPAVASPTLAARTAIPPSPVPTVVALVAASQWEDPAPPTGALGIGALLVMSTLGLVVARRRRRS